MKSDLKLVDYNLQLSRLLCNYLFVDSPEGT
jgi:hypothetical protein